ncbi:MAG: DUF2157 domain-containing protein [Mariniphaga sp.]
MSLLKELPELVSANIITAETARQINIYYQKKHESSPNRQLLIFGILGAILIGTGLLFIVANQWDQFSQFTKTTCAFLLLIVPQLFGGYVLLQKKEKIVWRESAALLLFFAVGANISLVSQIYHINGEASTFILSWMILILPLVYLLDASALSLAYLFMSMIFGLTARGSGTFPHEEYLFWILFALPLPRYYQLFLKNPASVLQILHHWMIPLVLTQTLITISHGATMWMHPAYIFLFAVFYFIGMQPFFKSRPLLQNGYLVVGFAGTIISLLVMSFKTTWKDLGADVNRPDLFISPEFIGCVLLFALATALLYRQNISKKLTEWKLTDVTYLLFLLLFLLGTAAVTVAVVLVNLLVLFFGMNLLKEGARQTHLGVINLGMIIIALLAVCRSFDSDLTFVVKGFLFVLVGIGFFAANWLMIKKRKEYEV